MQLIPLFMPGSVHNGPSNGDDCGQMFPDKLRVPWQIPDRFPHYAQTELHSQPTPIGR